MSSFKFALLAAALSATPSLAAYDAVYAFGDSLVDAGNIYTATGGAIPSPSQGYFMGRFTNGYDYTDILSRSLTGHVTTPSLRGGTNFAFGGAQAAINVPEPGGLSIPSVVTQVGLYATAAGKADPNALYVVNIGGNDAFAIDSGNTGGLTAAQYAQLSVTNTIMAISDLNALGARHILVTGNPVPDAAGAEINMLLQSSLSALQPTLASPLLRFSYYDFYAQLETDPARYGFFNGIDTTTVCNTSRPVTNGRINCSGLFSFDGTHPTAKVQFALARAIGGVAGVNGVPEPASWAMMVAAFGIIGEGCRIRARKQLTAA